MSDVGLCSGLPAVSVSAREILAPNPEKPLGAGEALGGNLEKNSVKHKQISWYSSRWVYGRGVVSGVGRVNGWNRSQTTTSMGRMKLSGSLRWETNQVKCFMIISSIHEHLCDLGTSVWELLELMRGSRPA